MRMPRPCRTRRTGAGFLIKRHGNGKGDLWQCKRSPLRVLKLCFGSAKGHLWEGKRYSFEYQQVTTGYFIHPEYSAAASAQRSPSTPAETIPPAYPAPSPHGKSPFMRTCCRVLTSRRIRTGDDVRVSTAMSTASFVRNPWLMEPNFLKPCCSLFDTEGGSQKCNGLEISPGAYELFGRS